MRGQLGKKTPCITKDVDLKVYISFVQVFSPGMYNWRDTAVHLAICRLSNFLYARPHNLNQ